VAEGLGGANFGGELLLLFAQRAEVALHLQAVPELGRLAEKRSEADGKSNGVRLLIFRGEKGKTGSAIVVWLGERRFAFALVRRERG